MVPVGLETFGPIVRDRFIISRMETQNRPQFRSQSARPYLYFVLKPPLDTSSVTTGNTDTQGGKKHPLEHILQNGKKITNYSNQNPVCPLINIPQCGVTK